MGQETVGLLNPIKKVSERDALRYYLTAQPTEGPVQFLSSYHAALRDARGTTGRNPDTGVIERPEHLVTWLGAIGYLAFLDQVGTAVKRKRPGPRPKGLSSIEHCLRDFAPPGLSQRDGEVLYALRCSLSHDYSLFNKGSGKRAAKLRFRFKLHGDPAGALIEHARRRWKIDFTGPQPPSTETTVNVRALGDLAEACHGNVQEAWRTGRLAARVPSSELVVRYGFAFGEGIG